MVGIVLNPQGSRKVGGRGSNHERRVASIAVRLFDLLAGQHGLGGDYRNVLRIAALVHDAAKPQGARGHHIRGAQRVLTDSTLRLTHWQRRAVAFLVRYHRGDVPSRGQEEILIAGDGRGRLRKLLAILRAADALDSRRQSAAAIIVRLKSETLLQIRCLVEGESSDFRDRFNKRRKFALLRETLGLRVRVKVSPALASV
jgi:exopolyphosphatase/pppGpp-phosphohydrolase